MQNLASGAMSIFLSNIATHRVELAEFFLIT